MERELIYRIGETRAIEATVTANSAFAVAAVTISVYDSAGAVTINADTGSASPGATAATEQVLSYNLATGSMTVGDYTYLLSYSVGVETRALRGALTILPVSSKYDRWVERIAGWIMETGAGEALQQLSYRDSMRAADAAVRVYERDRPRRRLNAANGESLTQGTFEYSLPSDWTNEFSEILEFEYPVDATQQTKSFLDRDEWVIDELRSKWRFRSIGPSTGDLARYTYTARHTLSHTEDTLPARDFDAIAEYAAGAALLALANRAAQTSAPGIAADVVSYRTKQQEFRQQGLELQRLGQESWLRGREHAAAFAQWKYLPEHGRTIAL